MNDKTLVRYYDADKNRFLNGELSGCDGDWHVEYRNDGPAETDLFLSPGWIDMHTIRSLMKVATLNNGFSR